MKILDTIRSSISLKVSLTLVAVTIALTTVAAALIISREGRALEQQTLTKARLGADLGAHTYAKLFEQGIEHQILSIEDVFDVNYQPIKGYNFGKTPRFHTRYDFYTDAHMMALQDQYFASPDIVVAVGTDRNGYAPTHNARSMKPLVGDPAKDIEGNRSKRMFTDPAALKAAASLVPLIQKYRRDTGADTWIVSAPVFVEGRHWGCFRILVSVTELEAERLALLLALATMFAVFAVTIGGAIFVMVRRSMRPLVRLTTVAENISLGEGLETTITPGSTDEVGQMAKAIDRLRASLMAAMSRIGE